MKIPKRYYGPLIVLFVGVVVMAWGALTLTINNGIIVSLPNKNFAVEILPVGSTCPVYGSSVYNLSNATISLAWGSLTEPGSTSLLFCLENAGTGTSATFTQGVVSPSPSPGTIAISPGGSVSIQAQGVTPVTTTVTVTTGVPVAASGTTGYSFTLTIG